MNKFIYTLCVIFATAFSNAYSQEKKKDSTAPPPLHKPFINLYLRSELQNPINSSKQAALSVPEARVEIGGTIVPDLEYRLRYRQNGNFSSSALDKTPPAIDLGYIKYRFGTEKKLSLMLGKQAAFAGSWEFEKNPTFEYQYSEHINEQVNIFLLAMKLGYEVNDNHSFHIQLHNTVNNNFSDHLTKFGYVPNGLKPAQYPMGIYLSWLGNFFDKKLNTFWSYNLSQFASKNTNHYIAVGNRVNLNKFHAYLDLSYTSYAIDHPGIASRAITNFTGNNSFAGDISYTTAVARADYQFHPKWFLTTKYIYDKSAGKQIAFDRTNKGFLVGLEYKPYQSQDMKAFVYYYDNAQRAKMSNTESNVNFSMISLGMLYFIHVLK